MFALKQAGELPPGPFYTVQLDVSYKAMMPAESRVLVTVEVESLEGRKLWMRARARWVEPRGLQLAVVACLQRRARACRLRGGARQGGVRQHPIPAAAHPRYAPSLFSPIGRAATALMARSTLLPARCL